MEKGRRYNVVLFTLFFIVPVHLVMNIVLHIDRESKPILQQTYQRHILHLRDVTVTNHPMFSDTGCSYQNL